MRRRLPLSAFAFAAAWAVPAAAQQAIDAPRNYALTNARVVVAPGRVLERATVVLRGGRIEAVGDRVSVPAGMITIDLTGMTVYPGLIDVASSVGLPRIAAGGGFGGGGEEGGAPGAREGGPPDELSPARAAAEAFAPAATDLAAVRAAGVTTLGLAFDGGIFPGRVSAISARDDNASRLVLRSPVAQQVALGRRRGGGYPTTLMGTLAYIKQSFADARWDARAQAAFEKSPATSPRPEYDAEHRALQAAAAGSMPVWIQAATSGDLKRIIQLMKDIGVTDYVIVGAQEGYQVAEPLKLSGRPVIVSLNFPAPGQVTGRPYDLHVAPVSGADSEREQSDSAMARTLRGNAAALLRAGVPVALSSIGLSSPSLFRDRLLGAVEAGLTPDDALRALTVTPAQMLGLGSALGTIEPGRIANVIVVQGDLFARSGRVRHVFIEGEKYDVVEPPAGEGQRGGRRGGGPGAANSSAGPVVATGEWAASGSMQGTSFTFTLNVRVEADGLAGSISSEMGTTPLSGQQDGVDITLRGTVTTPNGEQALTVSGRITGNDMQGSIELAQMGSISFTARRRGGDGMTFTSFRGGNR